MAYYWATKYKDITGFVDKWMNEEKIIILCVVLEIQKEKHGMFSLITRY